MMHISKVDFNVEGESESELGERHRGLIITGQVSERIERPLFFCHIQLDL